MNIYRPNVLNFLFPLLLGVAGIRAVFSEPGMLMGFGVILISGAYGSGLWIVIDGYTAYWRELNKFTGNNPDVIWEYLGLPKPSTTSRVMTQVNSDNSYPVYDTREVAVSRETMQEIAKAYSSGKLQFSEREYASIVGGKVAVRKLQKEFKEAGYIRPHRKGDTSRGYAFTMAGYKKLQSYLLPSPDVGLQSNDG